MKILRYASGEDIRFGDQVTYHGEPGEVEFFVTVKTGRPDLDWYLDQHPDGGVMLRVSKFGRVFLGETSEEEDLVLVRRGEAKAFDQQKG